LCQGAQRTFDPGQGKVTEHRYPRGGIKGNSTFVVNIFYDGDGEIEIKRACFIGAGEGPCCFEGTHGTFGTKRFLQVQLPGMRTGSYRAQCYAEYVRDGEVQNTNMVAIQIMVGN